MKEQWRQLAAKFGALTLRERVVVLAGLCLATVVLFDFLVLDPLSAQKRRLTQQINEARTGIKAAETLKMAQPDPDAVKRAYRDALRKQIAEIDKDLHGMQKSLVPPDQMAKMLEGMLSHHRALQLVSLRKLPAKRFETPGAAPDAPKATGTAATDVAQSERSIYQHSFELTVQGSYADLHDYLVRLEKLPWQMFWGKISMSTGQYPRLTVTLTVHTLSFDKAWLIV